MCVKRGAAAGREEGDRLLACAVVLHSQVAQLRMVGSDDRAGADEVGAHDRCDALARAFDVHVLLHRDRLRAHVVDAGLDLHEVGVRCRVVGDARYREGELGAGLGDVRIRVDEDRVRVRPATRLRAPLVSGFGITDAGSFPFASRGTSRPGIGVREAWMLFTRRNSPRRAQPARHSLPHGQLLSEREQRRSGPLSTVRLPHDASPSFPPLEVRNPSGKLAPSSRDSRGSRSIRDRASCRSPSVEKLLVKL